MDWMQVLFLFFANASLIIWFRAESRADWRHMDSKVDAIREDMRSFQSAMLMEAKDFHARLCAIEEKKRK
jgi:hypothetical protein